MTPEITVACITAGLAFIGAILVALIQRHNAVAADVRSTKEQVQNSHATNLRDDMDDIRDLARMTLSSVEGLRDELRTERKERLALAAALASHKHAA